MVKLVVDDRDVGLVGGGESCPGSVDQPRVGVELDPMYRGSPRARAWAAEDLGVEGARPSNASPPVSALTQEALARRLASSRSRSQACARSRLPPCRSCANGILQDYHVPTFGAGRSQRKYGASMRIATWNVNSVKQRVPRLLPWLDERRPDVVCLQETSLRTKNSSSCSATSSPTVTPPRFMAKRHGMGWRSCREWAWRKPCRVSPTGRPDGRRIRHVWRDSSGLGVRTELGSEHYE